MPGSDTIVVGTCGNCGGAVTLPRVWMGTQRPSKSCESCGSTVRENYGPRLPMNPRPAAIDAVADLGKRDARRSARR